MFARIKKSGKYEYLQIVENRKEKGKVKQRVIATIGRMDKLQPKARVDTLIKSLSRYSQQTMMILTGKSDVSADAKKIGPALIFDRLWKQTGIQDAIFKLLKGRKFEFDVERAIFLTVLHRLMVSGSDRFCHQWRSFSSCGRIFWVLGLHPHPEACQDALTGFCVPLLPKPQYEYMHLLKLSKNLFHFRKI